MKASSDLATMIGWNAEAFARSKRIKPLGEYLKPKRDADPDAGAADLRAMIGRIKAKQEGGDGRHG